MAGLLVWLGELIGVQIVPWVASSISAGVTWLATYLAIKWGVGTWVVNKLAGISGMPQMPSAGSSFLNPTGVSGAYILVNTFFPLNEMFACISGFIAFWLAAIVWKRAWSGINKVSTLAK